MKIQKFSEFKALRESSKDAETFSSSKNPLKYLSESQITEAIELTLSGQESLLEFKLWDWLKDKASKGASWIADSAKKVFNSVKDFVISAKNTIVDFLSKSWNWIKSTVHKELSKFKGTAEDKVKAHIAAHSEHEGNIRKDVKNFKDVLGHLTSYFTGGLAKDTEKALDNASSEEVTSKEEKAAESDPTGNKIESVESEVDKALSESLKDILTHHLNETKDNSEAFSWNSKRIVESEGAGAHVPFLSTIGHKIAHYPPFSWLHNVKDWASAASNFAEKLSNLSAKLKGPGPHKYVYLGAIIGLITEFVVEQLAVSGIKDLAKKFAHSALGAAIIVALPALGIILKTMKWMATGLWALGVIEVVLKI